MAMAPPKNPIMKLQEICQQWKFPMPSYTEVAASMTEFGCECTVTLEGETKTYFGKGRNKKTAKTVSAEDAIKYVESTKPHLLQPPPLPDLDPTMMPTFGSGTTKKAGPSEMDKLAQETEKLDHTRVGVEYGTIIMRTRNDKGWTQRDLAQKINEKPSVVVEFESGKAVVNHAVLTKMERALGVHLKGPKIGQPLSFGRGRGTRR
ncbi:uncharacterized protein [Dysidea avara]|uniref:uncharacterized protein n=1 Tax=Dysidea avara TaxID=196820 RepID=UPI0033241DAE